MVGRDAAEGKSPCGARKPGEVCGQRVPPLLTVEETARHRPLLAGDEDDGRRRPGERPPPVLALRPDCEDDDRAPAGLGVLERDAVRAARAPSSVLEHDEGAAQDPVQGGAENTTNDGIGDPKQAEWGPCHDGIVPAPRAGARADRL